MRLEKEIAYIRDQFSCTVSEGKLLYKLARQAKSPIVEIGSWKGYSTIWLAKGIQSTCTNVVFAIDTFQGDIEHEVNGEGNTFDTFLSNIEKANVTDNVWPIKKSSEDVERSWGKFPIDLIFIDGDHNDIVNDFNRWEPHLQFGGVIALHDTVQGYSLLPYLVAIEKLYKSPYFKDVKRVGCITYATKTDRLTNYDKCKKQCALIRRHIFQFFHPYYIKILKILGGIRNYLINQLLKFEHQLYLKDKQNHPLDNEGE